MTVKAIPEEYHSVTPYLVCKGAAKAIDFYTKVFGAKEFVRMPGPDGSVMHAELKIGDSNVMLSDENPSRDAVAPTGGNARSQSLMLYIEDVDIVFKRAIEAGSKSLETPTDQFWGDRMGRLMDPFGHQWAIATHKEDVSPEEMQKRMAAMA